MEPQLKPVPLQNAQNAQSGWASTGSGSTVTPAANSVLRNTYWLLALSMLPTIAGAIAGTQLNVIALFRSAPIMTPLLMFGAMLGSLFVVTRLRNSAWGVPALFGFTFIAGLMLTPERRLMASRWFVIGGLVGSGGLGYEVAEGPEIGLGIPRSRGMGGVGWRSPPPSQARSAAACGKWPMTVRHASP